MNDRERDIAVAYLLMRATIGVNILVHGVSRLLAGMTTFAHSLISIFQRTPLPVWSVYTFGIVLPWLEAFLGLLLLIGLSTRIALIGGLLLIFVLEFGSNLRQDWESAGLQLIYASIYAVLLAYRSRNIYSLDAIVHHRQDRVSHQTTFSGQSGSARRENGQ